MRFFIYLCCFYVCGSLEVEEDTAFNNKDIFAEGVPENLEELIVLLERENLTPTGQNPVEFASNIWSGNSEKATVKRVNDEDERQFGADEVKKNLANIILAAQKKKKNNGEITLADIFPEANIRIGSDKPLTRQVTTPPVSSTEEVTTTTEPTTTTPEPTTTTENPANFPKTGDIELMVEDIVYSGHMIHWSVEQEYLAISDIWGQKYLRFAEIPPATTTIAPSTTNPPTTNASTTPSLRQAESNSTTSEPTTTAVPTTTAEPLPYEIKTLRVPKNLCF